MRQRRWIELFSDYDCEIRYHSGKVNVVDDALSRKERVKPKRVRAMNMIIQSSIKDRILAAQKEAVDEFAVLQKGLDKMIEQRSDRTLYYLDQIWVPLKGEVRTLIMDEAHKPKYSVHPGADKMYYDLRDRYWWLEKKKDLAEYSKPRALGTRLDINTIYHPRLMVRGVYKFKLLEDIALEASCPGLSGGSWDVYLPLVEFSYNNSYHSSMRCAPFEALYGRKRRKPLEYSVGDYVLLKVSPWKGVVRFGKKGKLAPRFVGSFEIVEKVGPVAYRLDLPKELCGVYDNPVEIWEREFKKLKRSRIAIVKVRWNSKRGPEFTWERCIGEELRGCDDPMLKLIDIPGMLHLEGRLLESRGCLLLVCRDDIGSREFTIYEMMKGCSVWTVRYLVNTDKERAML
ncbi:putative reverse transcriptase domain-containing protein [Tanacetum coccineum]